MPPLSLTTSERPIPHSVTAYCEIHNLLAYLKVAISLAEATFDPVYNLRIGVEADPETDEEAVIIDVSVTLGVDEAVSRKGEYTRRWVESVPPEVIGRIRLLLDID